MCGYILNSTFLGRRKQQQISCYNVKREKYSVETNSCANGEIMLAHAQGLHSVNAQNQKRFKFSPSTRCYPIPSLVLSNTIYEAWVVLPLNRGQKFSSFCIVFG